MDDLKLVRNHIVDLLRGGQAYETFDEIMQSVSPGTYGTVPPAADHSPWQILDHMRRTQRDLIEFIENDSGSGKYVAKDWPGDYWPESPELPSPSSWTDTVQAYLADRARLESVAADPTRALFSQLPAGTGQTLLRELLLAADHASYHLGQMVIVQRLLGERNA